MSASGVHLLPHSAFPQLSTSHVLMAERTLASHLSRTCWVSYAEGTRHGKC